MEKVTILCALFVQQCLTQDPVGTQILVLPLNKECYSHKSQGEENINKDLAVILRDNFPSLKQLPGLTIFPLDHQF